MLVKIEILVKNRNFGQKSKCWSKIKILVKNRKFGQKSKFWSKKINLLEKTNMLNFYFLTFVPLNVFCRSTELICFVSSSAILACATSTTDRSSLSISLSSLIDLFEVIRSRGLPRFGFDFSFKLNKKKLKKNLEKLSNKSIKNISKIGQKCKKTSKNCRTKV